MTNFVFAYLYRSNIPTQESWQIAINELALDLHLEISNDLDPLVDGCIFKCVLNRNKADVASFDLYNGPVEFERDADREMHAKLAGGRDFHFMLKSHFTTDSILCMHVFSCALIKKFNAVVSYDGLKENDGEDIEQRSMALLAEYNSA